MVDGILSGSLSSQEVHTVTGQVSPIQSVTGNISIGGYDDLPLYDGSYEITPTEQEQTVNTAGRVVEYDIVVDPIPDEYVDISESTLDNADELSEGVIAFGADGTQYVGTVPDKSASDITVSGDTVTVPPGRYTESISKAVAAGSRGTPSRSFMKTGEYHRTDFSFPNFTPGYMSSMPDLSSSLLTETRIVEPDDSVQKITPTGNSYYLDCVIVQAISAGTAGTPVATKGTVSNHSVSVTPSVTNTTGYIEGGSKTGTPVTVSASELVSGTKTISETGTGIDVTNYASVDVAIPSGSYIITLSYVYDDDEDAYVWRPDRTWAEIQAARLAGKDLLWQCDDSVANASVWDWDYASAGGEYVYYVVRLVGVNSIWNEYCFNAQEHVYLTDSWNDYYVDDATISSGSQLPSGVSAYGEGGVKYAGNAANRTSSDLTVSGPTVTAPAGYYGSTATASIGNATIDELHLTNLRFETGNNERWWAFDVTADVYGGYIASGQYAQAGSFHAIPANTTIIPTTSSQAVGGANYMMEGAVTVAAMPTGTAGTPTATKGTVSNHSVTVTPSVTNTTGYITGSTKTGTAVTVSASELVSGNLAITENGTNIDCSTYSTVSVNVSGGSSATIDTKTVTVSTVASSISFTGLGGTPKAFWVRCTTTLTRSSSYREYYVATMRYNGTNTTGNRWYRYNGQVSNITSGYSFSYSSGTLTLSSSGNQSTSPGAFYNGSYELVYVY